MVSTTFISVLALSATVFAEAANQKNYCNNNDMNIIKTAFTHPVKTCDYFVNNKYGVSPLAALDIDSFSKACVCITGRQASNSPAAAAKNDGAAASCNGVAQAALNSETRNPKQFCSFWLAQPWRPSSPFLNVRQISNACRCYFPAPTTTTTTAKKTTTTTSKKTTTTSAKTTTTSAKTTTTSAKTTTKSTTPAVTTTRSTTPAVTTTTTKSTTPATTTTRATTTPSTTPKITTTSSSSRMDATADSSATATYGFAKRYNARAHHVRK